LNERTRPHPLIRTAVPAEEKLMKILVTGGMGFIGSNFIRLVLAETSHAVVNLDALTYAGNPENLAEVEKNERYRFVKGDVRDGSLLAGLLAEGFDAVVNFAAESHVDRSIESPAPFLDTNVMGTAALLDAARRFNTGLFLQVSTDEVYGSAGPEGGFSEDSPLSPTSPYAASKAAADLVALAYARTWGVPVIITRSSNNYGPYQFPEKVVPLFITNAMEGEPLPLYGDGLHRRDWLHVEDDCRAILLAMEEGEPGKVYNVGGGAEVANIELAKMILDAVGAPHELIRRVEDRPGHDRRYAVDSTRIQDELGFTRDWGLEEGIEATVRWYRDNRRWWEKIKSGEYREYYERMYKHRLEDAGS